MKKIYPRLITLFGSMIFYGIAYFLILYLMILEESNMLIFLLVMIPLGGMFIILMIGLTENVQIKEDCLMYKETFLSKPKKVFIEDVKKITFNYFGRDARVKIIYRDKKITGNKNRVLSIASNAHLMQELLTLIPSNLFNAAFIYKLQVPKKHRGILLKADILDEKQREKLS